jgi:hypothetical protein
MLRLFLFQGGGEMMKYEVLTVNEYCGNYFTKSYEAKLYENGKLEPLPEPDYPDIEEFEEPEDNEEDLLWMRKS